MARARDALGLMSQLLSKKDRMQILKYTRKVNAFRTAECAICYEGACDAVTSCYLAQGVAHRFHSGCLERWRSCRDRLSCPLCRTDLDAYVRPFHLTPPLETLTYADLLRVLDTVQDTDVASGAAMYERLSCTFDDRLKVLEWYGVVEEALGLDWDVA